MTNNSNQNYPNILIVDDNEINLLLISGILEDNYNLTTISKSSEVFDTIKNQKFDLILLDIMMEGFNGFDICKILKSNQETSEIPVIFLTAFVDNQSIEHGYEVGAVDYITKPYNRYELLAKVKNHIRLKLTKELIREELIERLHAEKKIKEQETKFRSIFENSTDAIILLNPDGSVQNANFSALKYLKYELNEITRLNFSEVINQGDIEEIEFNIKNLVVNKASYKKECYLKSKDNSQIPVEMNINLIQFGTNNIVLCIIRDISERKQMETKLVSTIFQTEEKERARFSKDIHDGLGALLSSINIYLNLIWTEKLTQAEFETYFIYTKGLLEETITATREIANNIRPTVLTRYGLVSTINSFIEKINSTKKIFINFEHSEFSLELDKDMEIILFRIINELINNTLKHANATKIDIILKYEEHEIVLKYSDNGTGFDVLNLYNNKLSANKLSADKLSGNGLNNILSRIKSINGKTQVKSKLGEGVILILNIPYNV